MFRARFLLIWSLVRWTRLDLDHLASSSVLTTLCLVRALVVCLKFRIRNPEWIRLGLGQDNVG